MYGRALSLRHGLAALGTKACQTCVNGGMTDRPPPIWLGVPATWITSRRSCAERVKSWSAAIAANDPLEPWLSESALDDAYWDDVGTEVVIAVAPDESTDNHRAALVTAMISRFGTPDSADASVYREDFHLRVDRIVASALSGGT